jgi:cysteine-rich repeat protein
MIHAKGWGWYAIGCALLVLAFGPRRVNAAIDAGGTWYAEFQGFPVSCTVQAAQGAATLDMSGDCLFFSFQAGGTFDSASGSFLLTGDIGGPFAPCPDLVMNGTVAPDGASFTTSFDCSSIPPIGPLVGTRCGNGVLDAGESCDDGNRSDGDCCTSSCAAAPAGISCAVDTQCDDSTCDGAGGCTRIVHAGPCDDSNPCTGSDQCVDGYCTGEMLSDVPCDDGDFCSTNDTCMYGYCEGDYSRSGCDACSYCDSYEQACIPYMETACEEPTVRATADVRDSTSAGADTVAWTFRGAAGEPLDFGDPRTDTDYAICGFAGGDPMYGEGRLLFVAKADAGGTCGAASCWKPRADGYNYADRTGTSGIRKLELRTGESGVRLKVRAKGDALHLGPLPTELPMTVQVRSSIGRCWSATYDTASVNGPTRFKSESAR